MERFLPQKNKHTLRSALFAVAIICVSAGIAYGVQKHVLTTKSVLIVSQPQPQPEDAAQTEAVAVKSETTAPTDQAPQIITPALAAPPEPAPVVVLPMPAVRSKDHAMLLEEAKMYTQPQITTGKYIDISLKYQNMVIFEDGKPLDAYMVSSGMKGHPTPIGTFKIENKSPRAWSKLYGLWMPYWMAYLPDGEMGLQELPVGPGGHREGAAHLGIPVSHGCVRLGIGPAKRVYDWADLGTPVVIHQ